jgi:hypothetical protein
MGPERHDLAAMAAMDIAIAIAQRRAAAAMTFSRKSGFNPDDGLSADPKRNAKGTYRKA